MKKKNKFNKLILASVIALGISASNLAANAADYSGGYNELLQAIISDGTEDLNRNYIQTGDISFEQNTPKVYTSGSILNIDGNGHTINGNNFSFIKMNYTESDQTTNLTNINISNSMNVLDNWGANSRFNISNSQISGAQNSAIRSFNSGGLENTITNSSFYGNYSGYSGGAIANSGLITITDCTFTNNSTRASRGGGAIFNTGGILNIQASNGGLTLFDQNTSGGGISDAIAISSGEINLDAGTGGIIRFNDSIWSSDQSTNLNINSNPLLNSGEIIFNRPVNNITINLNGGTLTLGGTGNASSSPYLQDVNLNLNAGTLNMENGVATDVLNLNNFTAAEGSSIKFDVDFAKNNNDKINANTATGTLNVAHINVIDDGEVSNITLFTNGQSPTLSNFTAYTNDYQYQFTPGTTAGTFDISSSIIPSTSALINIAKSTEAYRTFSAAADETLDKGIGTMGGANSTLNIVGNGYNINGNGYGCIKVLAGQTLNISTVGSIDSNGNILSAWNGHDGGLQAGVIKNQGNLNISDSIFYNNTSSDSAGVIYSKTTDTSNSINIDHSLFANNSSANGAGTIFIDNSESSAESFALNISNSAFKSNSGNQSFASSVHVLETLSGSGQTSNMNISDSYFVENTSQSGATGFYYEGYNQGNGDKNNININITNSNFNQNTASSSYGGPVSIQVSNDSGILSSDINIQNCSFLDNVASGGSAIGALSIGSSNYGSSYNSKITVNNSSFVNNSVDGEIGALSIGTENNSSNFIGEYTISNSTFERNQAQQSVGALDFYNILYADSTGTQSKLTVDNVAFNNNHSSSANAGAFRMTVESYNNSQNGDVQTIIQNSNFDSNSSFQNGGAFFSNINLRGDSHQVKTEITDSTFTNNYSEQSNGGAIYQEIINDASNSSITTNITGSTFDSNTTNSVENGSGGALYYNIVNNGSNLNANFNVNQSTFTNNHVEARDGGAISIVSQDYSGDSNITSTIDASTFTNNSAQNGGAINVDYFPVYNNLRTIIKNSNFTDNTATQYGGAIYQRGGTLNIIADGADTVFSGNTDSAGSNDIYVDTAVINLNASANNSITLNGGVNGVNEESKYVLNINKTG